MSSYADLIVQLAVVELPVVAPGAPDKALPCISIEPTSIGIESGQRVGWERCNVVVRYPLAENNSFQFERLNASTYAAIRALIGTRFLLDAETPLFGEADAQTPMMKYVIGVTFASDHSVCPPANE